MFILKRKIFTLNNKYSIYDSNNNVVYTAHGKYLFPKKHIRIYDNTGKEVLCIKKKLLRIMPEFDVYSEDKLIAKLKRKYLYDKYMVLIFNGPSIQFAESKYWSKKFTIYSGKQPLIIIQKILSFAHAYTINYADDQDPVLATAYGIIIDTMFRKYSR